MNQTSKLIETLKKQLKLKGYTYLDLANELDLSEPTIKRMFSVKNISLQRVEEICSFLDIDFYELALLYKKSIDKKNQELTTEQERILAENPKLMTLLYFLMHGWPLSLILEEYDFNEIEITGMMLKLDKFKLIELRPENNFKLLVSKNTLWKIDGPIWNYYKKMISDDFFDHSFKELNERFIFTTGQFSKKSLKIIIKELDKFTKKFNALAEEDTFLPLKDRNSTGVIIGFRPWVFSLISNLRRR
ncbi:MAG: helix-turn-helix transcriptional regulator [Desulfobacterales bacterium]|nr:helix-turn-helix transcriptional regulator [Desulfobacterales bacterium]